MKSSKWIIATGVVLSAGILLAGCGKSTSSTSTYSYVYTQDPDTLNYLMANRATTSDVVTNLVDGLLENDQYGNLVPALAKSWTVSKDGLTYTYTLRKDAKWYTSEGEEYAGVKAQDFVTGLKYVADNKSEALYLVQDSVKGLDAYVNGETKDFSTVGVKALDDYTVQYTLSRAEPYWNSKTTNNILFPVNADFLKSQGKNFGSVKPTSILYNGPYLLKSLTAKSSMEFAKNPHYYDKKNVHLDNIKLTYYDGSDQEALIRNFTDGAYSTARLYPNSSSFASVKKQYANNIIYSLQDATSYYYNFNLNRQSYNHTSKKTDAQKSSTQEAVLNKAFRQAINFAYDRTSYGAQSNGKDGATKVLRNTLVPPTFVSIGDKTFGDVVSSKLVNYGSEWSNMNLADAQDAYYNPEKAKAKFAQAKAELQAKGVQFPIHLDVPVEQTSKIGVQWASSMKQSVESVLGKDNVVIDIQQMSSDELNNIGYFANTAAQKDYDLYNGGWSGDYQDPSTYLDTLNTKNGGSLQNFGLEPGQENDKIKAVGLDTYTTMLEEANAETNETARYEKYAEAQAWLIDSGLTMPNLSLGGTSSVTKTVPFSRSYSLVGIKGGSGYYFKYVELQDKIVTTKEYENAKKKWLKEKEVSNKKAQDDYENHVK
ncbi:Oligopeptide-binding protein SarA precursor [Streptococcus constellatus]|uniref:Oligopeptide-binding protein SarA n=1 Tax=Streptococcus constellatus TaxID=76860 RepID=A0A564TS40_STRCV|nr:peptide ABC transporter substrate-binding protein [Streptococcus constellatus]VUX00082.1 Oligopeptide-binding protein SarA precursor [Streptococcus gordonii]VUX10068.1 Oligopeptide-binding protein SarA precursor [Streptococcus constellatus]